EGDDHLDGFVGEILGAGRRRAQERCGDARRQNSSQARFLLSSRRVALGAAMRLARVSYFALLLACLASVCLGQGAYPSKPVRIVVTFTPGGAADFTARIVADKWSELWQQQVIVENRIGAGGSIGAEAVQKAPADGTTLLLVASAHAFNAALYPNLSFDLLKDFVPLGLATSTPMALAVNPRMAVADLKEFTALLQARPHQ